MIILIYFTIFIVACWLALAIRLAWIGLRSPVVRPESIAATFDDPPRVAVVVAARNEERDIGETVATLLSQEYKNFSITIVDDQSTDGTPAILEKWAGKAEARDRLRIVKGEERPDGWVGKTWAVRQGTLAAEPNAAWLWFVDGDMRLDPRALSTALAFAAQTNADLVSFLPAARCETFWQSTVCISLGMILAHAFPFPRVNDPNRPDALAAGGFLLVKRTIYEQVGGHQSVRAEIVEDIALARAIKRAGGRLAVAAAPSLANTHAYGSLREIWIGLRKNAYAGMNYQFHQYIAGAILAFALAWTPLVGVIAGIAAGNTPLIVAGVAAWIAQAIAVAPLVWVLKLPPWHLFFVPLGMSLYVAIATSSVWHHSRGRTLWKDRVFKASSPDPSL